MEKTLPFNDEFTVAKLAQFLLTDTDLSSR